MPTRSRPTPAATPFPPAGVPVKASRSRRTASGGSKKARAIPMAQEPAPPPAERPSARDHAASRPGARKGRDARTGDRAEQQKVSEDTTPATGKKAASSGGRRDRSGTARPAAGAIPSPSPVPVSKAAAPKAAAAAKAPGRSSSDDRRKRKAAAPAGASATVTKRPAAPKADAPKADAPKADAPTPPARRRTSAASGGDRRRRAATAPSAGAVASAATAPSAGAVASAGAAPAAGAVAAPGTAVPQALPDAAPTEVPHVVGLWRAAHGARASASPEAMGAQRSRVASPSPVSIQVLTVPERDLVAARGAAIATRADFLPPAVVLCLQLVVGWVIGASPLVLIVGAAAIIAVAYVVWSTSRARRAAMPANATGSLAAQVGSNGSSAGAPPLAPPFAPRTAVVARPPAPLEGQASTDSSAPVPAPTPARPASDLRWLWGTILRDPTARSSRRDR